MNIAGGLILDGKEYDFLSLGELVEELKENNQLELFIDKFDSEVGR